MVVSEKSTTFVSTNPTTLLVARPADQGGTFLLYGINKQPITLAEQINTLKQRGLIFEDENATLRILSQISYFRLASYWRIMENAGSCIFRHTVKAVQEHE